MKLSPKPILEQIAYSSMSDKPWDNRTLGADERYVKVSEQGTETRLATRHNQGKPEFSLLPTKACEEEARVWAFGSKKYGRSDWRRLWGNDTVNTVCDSALRHIFAMLDGETHDPESGLLHAAHVRCNMAMIIEHLKKGTK